MSTPIKPIQAGVFHAGSTCPFCQEQVTEGQLIITCPGCSTVHHETCWMHKNGCSSYHCDKAVSGNAAAQKPDIVIQAGELKDVYVPPPASRRGGQEIAAAFLPKKPERVSILAILSAAAGVAAFVGIAGAILGRTDVTLIGLGLAVVSTVLGVIAMVFISNTNNRISGMPLAGGSVMTMFVLIVAYFVCLGVTLKKQGRQQRADMTFAESLPSPARLASMAPPLRNAMRANVVLQCGGSGFGETSYGSGIILKIANNRAMIITNKHVIGDCKEGIKTLFYTGENGLAKVEWLAPNDVDIAILSCPVLGLGDYQTIEVSEAVAGVGDKVFAIGNPMALPWSYTEGTISSVRDGQSGVENMASVQFYQTQTPINSGNSGGGLYTEKGALIGINTLTHDKATSEGLSFSITTAHILKQMSSAERERFFGRIIAPSDKSF